MTSVTSPVTPSTKRDFTEGREWGEDDIFLDNENPPIYPYAGSVGPDEEENENIWIQAQLP